MTMHFNCCRRVLGSIPADCVFLQETLSTVLYEIRNFLQNIVHCPESNPNFRDITRNLEENEIPHEIFRVVSRFPRYISCYISENPLSLGQ